MGVEGVEEDLIVADHGDGVEVEVAGEDSECCGRVVKGVTLSNLLACVRSCSLLVNISKWLASGCLVLSSGNPIANWSYLKKQ